MKAKFNSVYSIVLLLATEFSAGAATHHVNVNSASPTPPYTTWATAATQMKRLTV